MKAFFFLTICCSWKGAVAVQCCAAPTFLQQMQTDPWNTGPPQMQLFIDAILFHHKTPHLLAAQSQAAVGCTGSINATDELQKKGLKKAKRAESVLGSLC
jgi:hypothetical protein